MPLNKHFDGKGEKVMRDLMRKYGAKKGKQMFYAIENKRKKKTLREKALKGMKR